MQLDTQKTLGEIEPDADRLRNAMIEIAQHTTTRGVEEEWARKLRFLTPALQYEDSQCLSSDDSVAESDLQSENASLASEEVCICQDRTDRIFNEGDRWLDVWSAASEPERRLELLPADAAPGCIHYLIVSYCWSSSAKAPYSGKPFFVKVDGSWRTLRCPPALLERLLRLCSFAQYCFIWIDQECIDQDDIEDKQIGIRAMDLVYQRAGMCVAVLEVCLSEQRHVDALEVMFDEAPGDAIELDTLLAVLEALEMVLADPWFSRAWTLQESTSSSRNLTLLLRYAEALQVPSTFEYFGNIQLDLAEANNLISAWLPLQLELQQDINAADLARGNRLVDFWFTRNIPNVDQKYDEDARVVCNGAGAIWFLEKRHNTVVSDRLAIMANLCGYAIRLQATEIEMAGYDFSVAAMTLAALNGDVSMLVGHYGTRGSRGSARIQQSEMYADCATSSAHGFSWCPPADVALGSLALLHDKDSGSLNIEVRSLSARGLQVRGCIWVADRALDLSDLQSNFRNNVDEGTFKEVLSLPILDTRASEPAVRVRKVRVAALTELLCRLVEQGFEPLAQQLWAALRQRATASDIDSSESIRAYDAASLDAIVDVPTRVHKWKSPIPPRSRDYAYRDDPFKELGGHFAMCLLTAVMQKGQLVLARPQNRDRAPNQYRGVFDTALPGDMFFSPCNTVGETLDKPYEWFRLNWRVRPAKLSSNGQEISMCAPDLVAGFWEADEDCLSDVYFM